MSRLETPQLSRNLLGARVRGEVFTLVLELLSQCGMIWRSLERTLLQSVRKSFGSTGRDSRSCREEGTNNRLFGL
jgi:hypothetical protein